MHGDHDDVVWLQRALARSMGTEEDVLLEITIPLTAGEDDFRVGWSLKGLRSRGWIAITTGKLRWNVKRSREAADHVVSILHAAFYLVNGHDSDGERH